MKDNQGKVANLGKFDNPVVTADGSARGYVTLSNPDTLWFNTGTLCNIACVNCYIESSPSNDALVYLTTDDVVAYLDQLEDRAWSVREIGFTGGEPFMNPAILPMLRASLERGYEILVLTNAMRPMMRPKVMEGLAALIAEFRERLTLRVSLDHYSAARHDDERGVGSFERSLIGMAWLRDQSARMTVAGRTMWGESEAEARAGFAALYEKHRLDVDANDPGQTVLFPEMDETVDVPEITTACWDILGKSPDDIMCASSRMVVKRKGAERASVVACTLLPYDLQFDMGHTLAEAERDVFLNHPHCAKFCVLGGASCSA